jgi:hypothetical protein
MLSYRDQAMLHPVGSLPPSVYWRRRVMLLAALVGLAVLIALTLRAVSSHDPASKASGSTSGARTTAPSSPTSRASSTSASSSSASSSGSASTAGSSASSSAPVSGSAASAPCQISQLNIEAAAQAASYKVGDEPVVMLQVTNVGTANCTADLADPMIELRIYNGAARVWGSHDCKVQPGTDVETLVPGTTVAKAIQWSGLSSQAGCLGTRQRVGAGTYTVLAFLNGTQGTPAQFTIA